MALYSCLAIVFAVFVSLVWHFDARRWRAEERAAEADFERAKWMGAYQALAAERRKWEVEVRADERTRSRSGMPSHDPSLPPMVKVPRVAVPIGELTFGDGIRKVEQS
jgi:hypothetical protein